MDKTSHDVDFGLQEHPRYSWLAGSPDGITDDCILLEVKCPYRRKIKMGFVPEYYYPQLYVNMEIYDLEMAHYIEYCPGTLSKKETLNIVEVKRNTEWFNKQLPVLQKFVTELREKKDTYKEKRQDYVVPVPKKLFCMAKTPMFQTYAFKKRAKKVDKPV